MYDDVYEQFRLCIDKKCLKGGSSIVKYSTINISLLLSVKSVFYNNEFKKEIILFILFTWVPYKKGVGRLDLKIIFNVSFKKSMKTKLIIFIKKRK